VFRQLTSEENLLAVLETPSYPGATARPFGGIAFANGSGDGAGQQSVHAIRWRAAQAGDCAIAYAGTVLLLLDEPFSGIDPLTVKDLQEIIRNLAQSGIGVLITDHNVRETLTVTDRAYILKSGKIFRKGGRRISATIRKSAGYTWATTFA